MTPTGGQAWWAAHYADELGWFILPLHGTQRADPARVGQVQSEAPGGRSRKEAKLTSTAERLREYRQISLNSSDDDGGGQHAQSD